MSAVRDDHHHDVRVRLAHPDDHVSAMRVLDGSLLAVDATTVSERIECEAVLVAVVESTLPTADSCDESTEHVVGTLVLDVPEREGVAPRPEEIRPDTRHVEAIAVTHQRRRQGIGRALIEGTLEVVGCDRLTAAFRPEVEPFYDALGFRVEPLTDGRRWGELRVGR